MLFIHLIIDNTVQLFPDSLTELDLLLRNHNILQSKGLQNETDT